LKGKTKMNLPFYQERIITSAREIAERNGFFLVEHHNYPGKISAMTSKAPYAKDIVIKAFDSWYDVIIFFSGYEQHAFENSMLQPTR